ncbi:MAG: tetratricopeptide repeat protein [Elainellaceae cyanobacterium]
MSQPSNYFSADDDPVSALSLDECRRRLHHDSLPTSEELQLLCRLGQIFIEAGEFEQALASLNRALRLKPDEAIAHYYRGQALEGIGGYDNAVLAYDQALASLSNPQTDLAARVWIHRGNALRILKRPQEALESYDQAIAIQPQSSQALSHRAVILAMLKRRGDALANSDRAIALHSDSYEVWNNHGIILLMAGRPQEALTCFDRSIDYHPNFDKSWNNRAIALSRIGREPDAIYSIERALHLCVRPHEPWCGSAWAFHGFLLMKSGQFKEAIASYEKAQTLHPNSYPAAFYKLICSILTGRIFSDVLRSDARPQLLHDVTIIGRSLRYRLIILFGAIGLLILGQRWLSTHSQNTWLQETTDTLIPTILSIGIVALIVTDLWRNKSKLDFVWATYFHSGILTYLRAVGIIAVTLTTFNVAGRIAPPFLLWGWANWVFGQPGNVILQPLLNLLESAAPSSPQIAHVVTPAQDLMVSITGAMVSITGAIALNFSWQITPNLGLLSTPPIRYAPLLILVFWLLLLLGIPFWARLEERIFRQGANTWKQIGIRSTQFGLVHLLAGIPILGGFVLIVPGFLFACRYKYVYDRHLQKYRDPMRAQEAGVRASTADHAIYNAILISIVVSTLLLAELSVS